MIRRSLSALALVSALSASAGAKPPDLPMNETITVTPKGEPPMEHAPPNPPLSGGVLIFQQTEYDSHSPDVMAEFLSKGLGIAPGFWANDGSPYAHPLRDPLISTCTSNPLHQGMFAESEKLFRIFKPIVAEEPTPAPTFYDMLPDALPTPAVYQLRPTARNTLVGSLLFGVNPLLALLPTDKALDAPHDHPQKVAGDDILSDIPSARQQDGFQDEFVSARGCVERQAFEKWLMSHWAARHASPSPEEHEGYVHAIDPAVIARLTPADTPVTACSCRRGAADAERGRTGG